MEGAKQYKILVSDSVSEKGIQLLDGVAQVDLKPNLSPQEILDIIGEYDALLVRSGTRVTAEVISAGKNLKVIGRAGVGVDNIDVEKATEQGILVINAPEGNTISAAEHTMALMLSLARNIPPAASSLRAGQWQRNKFIGLELYKKCLGIIGLGRIGTEVAKRARAFGMKVLAYDPYISAEQAAKIGVVAQSLEEILPQADFITLHVPKSSATRHLLGAKELAGMKDGVRIINCARGGLIDEKALYEAIVAGKVAGVALDVFEEEPPANNNPLLQLEQVISTPHLGASTQEAQINVAVQVAEEMVHVLKGEPLHMAVNAPVLPPKLLGEIEPFVPLMKILGSFYMQVFNGRVENIEITYRGSVAEYPVTSLTTALLIGFLRVMLNSNINFVNAPLIAKQRGIKVQEITSKGDDPIFNNLVTVKVVAGGKVASVAGTIFGRNDIRIVQIGDYRIEVVPSRFMLICKYTDKPGVIGKVGTILGDNDINIAGMQVGRREVGGEAIMVLQVDNHVQDKVLEELKTVAHVLSAKAVEIKPYFSETAI